LRSGLDRRDERFHLEPADLARDPQLLKESPLAVGRRWSRDFGEKFLSSAEIHGSLRGHLRLYSFNILPYAVRIDGIRCERTRGLFELCGFLLLLGAFGLQVANRQATEHTLPLFLNILPER
jgi:hypothetical protein